nr:hypothetical protein [Sphingomonas sp. CDS-1]
MKQHGRGSPHHKQGEHPPKLGTSPSNGWTALVVVAVISFLVLASSKCSSDRGASDAASSEASNAAQQAIGSAIAAQVPPSVEPLNFVSVKKAGMHLKVVQIEGLPGEMIYSQNCYDALSRQFSWSKLDACGAFDMSAVQALGDDEAAGNEKEVEWFQSETAASRYLKAAVSAGEDADEADVRLSDLQSRVANAQPKPTKEATPDIEGETSDNAVSNSEAVGQTEAG